MTDEELIAFLKDHPRSSLASICGHFNIPYCYSKARRSPDGMDYGYTPEAKAVRYQLQRLRMARRLETQGQRWFVKEGTP